MMRHSFSPQNPKTPQIRFIAISLLLEQGKGLHGTLDGRLCRRLRSRRRNLLHKAPKHIGLNLLFLYFGRLLAFQLVLGLLCRKHCLFLRFFDCSCFLTFALPQDSAQEFLVDCLFDPSAPLEERQ